MIVFFETYLLSFAGFLLKNQILIYTRRRLTQNAPAAVASLYFGKPSNIRHGFFNLLCKMKHPVREGRAQALFFFNKQHKEVDRQ